jgi:hypothetical protein
MCRFEGKDHGGKEIMNKPPQTEGEVQKSIREYLDLRKILYWRNQSHPVPFRRFTGLQGVSDICAVYKGRFYGIEVKGPEGTLSDEQKKFRDRLIRAGGIYIEARSLDDVIRVLPIITMPGGGKG